MLCAHAPRIICLSSKSKAPNHKRWRGALRGGRRRHYPVSTIFLGFSSTSSVCQLSQSRRLQWNMRFLVPSPISTTWIELNWHPGQSLGTNSLRICKTVFFSRCMHFSRPSRYWHGCTIGQIVVYWSLIVKEKNGHNCTNWAPKRRQIITF